MTFQSFPAQYLGSQDTMTDVRFSTIAGYSRCIDSDYTYIVQQGCLFNKLLVGMQFRMAACYLQGLIGNSTTMHQEYMAQPFFRAVLINQFQRGHRCCFLTQKHSAVAECFCI